MPSYLYQEQFVPTPVYKSPLDLYGQALQVKDAKFKAGLQNIRSRYDSILNADLTNSQNQLKVRAGVEDAMNRLNKTAVSDLSLPENQAQVNSLFDNILDDDILYDMAWTKNYRNQVYKAETMQKNKPELVTPQNLHPLYRAQEAYGKGDPGLRPGLVQFQPYHDYDKKYNDTLDKVKADVDLAFSSKDLIVTMPDGKQMKVGMMTQQKITQVKDFKIRQMMWDRISSDPQALGQMKLDYDYNKDYGLYSSLGATENINKDLLTFRNLAKNTTSIINSGTLGPEEQAEYQKQLDYYNLKVTDLNRVRDNLSKGGDPTEYFTYNQFIKDYVDGKSEQYSYRQEDLLHAYPGYDKLIDGEISAYKEKLKADKEGVALTPDNPYERTINSLIENPDGVQVDDDVLSAFMETPKDNEGRYWYNLSFDNKDPLNRVIVKPATHSLTGNQATDLTAAGILFDLQSKLEKIGGAKAANTRPGQATGDLQATMSDPTASLGSPTGVGGRSQDSPYDYQAVPKQSGQEVLLNYIQDPFYYTESQRKEIQATIDRYAPALDRLKVDYKSREGLDKINQTVSDPSIQAAIGFGQDLSNMNFKGRLEFRPDQEDLALGTSGSVYTKGRLMISKSELDNKNLKVSIPDLVKAGILSREEISTVKTADGKTVGEQMYGMSVYLPVQGSPEDINERMLRNSNAFEGLGKETSGYKQAARTQVRTFVEEFNNAYSGGYEFTIPFTQTGENFTPNPQGELGQKEVERINKLAAELASSTGQKVEDVLPTVYNIIGQNKTPLKVYQGIRNLGQNLNLKLQGAQKEVVSTIESVGSSLGVSSRDIQIAKLVAMTESGARNLDYGDRDSLGVFQQRANWGSVEERTNVETSTKKFFEALLKIKDRANKTPWQVAQEVQQSAWTGKTNADNKGDTRVGGNYQDIWNKYFNQ